MLLFKRPFQGKIHHELMKKVFSKANNSKRVQQLQEKFRISPYLTQQQRENVSVERPFHN